MSNTFDFNRFKKVFVRDFHATYSRFGLALLIIILIPFVFWLMQCELYSPDQYSYDISLMNRIRRLMELLLLAVAIAPGIIYKSCNVKGRGNYFALLPASTYEKYLSMFLYCCVVVPAAIAVGILVLDTLLALLPIGPYHKFIWQVDDYYDDFYVGLVWYIVYSFLAASIFMFTNTIFKRAKFVKTVLWLLLIGVVALIFSWPLQYLGDILYSAETAVWAIPLIVAIVLQYFTYIRLKKMQY